MLFGELGPAPEPKEPPTPRRSVGVFRSTAHSGDRFVARSQPVPDWTERELRAAHGDR